MVRPSALSPLSGFTSLVVLGLTSCVLGAEKRGAPIYLPVRTGVRPDALRAAVEPRGSAVANVLSSADFYAIEVAIGAPGQVIALEVDTGSWDLWVNPNCSNAGPLPGSSERCQAAGQYFPSDTSTPEDPATATHQETGFGQFSGDVDLSYYTDFVDIGVRLTNQIFGVATSSHNVSLGKMGLGPHPVYGFNETLVVSEIANLGYLNSRTFSLTFPSLDKPDGTGTLVFGGVDKGKFTGGLEKLSIIPPEAAPVKKYANWIRLDGLQLYVPPASFATKLPLPQTLATGGTGVIIDSGSSSIALPANITQAIYTQLGVVPDTSLGITLNKVDCGLRASSAFLSFAFNDTEVSIEARELILDGESIGKAGSCYLLLYPNDIPLLGAPFLRAAYAIFDWDNLAIHIARSATCGTDIQALGSGSDPVGNIVGNCFPSPKKAKLKAPAQRRW